MMSVLLGVPQQPNRVEHQVGGVHRADAGGEVPAHARLEGRLVRTVGQRKYACDSVLRIRVKAVVGAGAIDVVIADSDVVKRAERGRATWGESFAVLLSVSAVLQPGEGVVDGRRVALAITPDLVHQRL